MFVRKRNDHCLNKICLNYVFFFLPVGGAGRGRGRGGGVLGKLFIGAWGKNKKSGQKVCCILSFHKRFISPTLYCTEAIIDHSTNTRLIKGTVRPEKMICLNVILKA